MLQIGNYNMKISCFYWSDKQNISRVADALRNDKIVLGASDTILGLLAPVSQKGFDALNKIKGRTDKPYIVLIGSPKKMGLFVQEPLSDDVKKLIDYCWPGPLTLIVKAKKDISHFLRSLDGTIALRMPAHKPLLALLKEFSGLFSTSANKADKPVPQMIEDIDQDIVDQTVFCIFDSEKKKESSIFPSTILDCTEPTIRVIREGAYSIDELEKVTGQTFEK